MKSAAIILSAVIAIANGQGPVTFAEMYEPGSGSGGSQLRSGGLPAPAPAPVALPFGGGQVANNMPGWLGASLTGSRFFAFPESQILNYAYIPHHEIAAGSYIRVWCAKHSDIQKCDLFLNIYKCNDCGTDMNADFMDYLITHKWQPSQCGPKFISDAGEDEHKFMSFRKQVASDSLEVINFNSEVVLAFLTINSNSVDCSDLNALDCETSGYQCKLVNGVCTDDWCPSTFRGPCAPPCGGCHNCALKEAAFQ